MLKFFKMHGVGNDYIYIDQIEVIKNLDLKLSVGELSGMVSVQSISNTEIISITVVNRDAKQATKIANEDQIATWKIVMAETQTVKPKQPVPIQYYILKDGFKVEPEDDVVIQYSGNLYKKQGTIYSTSSGRGQIKVMYKGTVATQEITISEEASIGPILLGDEKLRVGESADYTLKNTTEVAKFEISDETLVKVKRKTADSCTVYANEENKTGFVTLIARVGNKEVKKEIAIVPLWQVK